MIEKLNNINDFILLLKKYKNIYNLSRSELVEIGKDESVPYVLRKFVKLISSDDEKLSLEALKYLHNLTSSDNIVLEISSVNQSSDGIYLNKNQLAIFNNIKKKCIISDKSIGDIELLKLLAINIDHYNQVKQVSEINNFKMVFKNGTQQIRPEFTVMKECTTNIKEIIDKLGLSTNAALKYGNIIELTDPLDKLL